MLTTIPPTLHSPGRPQTPAQGAQQRLHAFSPPPRPPGAALPRRPARPQLRAATGASSGRPAPHPSRPGAAVRLRRTDRPPLASGGRSGALRLPGPRLPAAEPRPPTHAAPPRPAGGGPSPPAGPRAHVPHRRRTPPGRHPPAPRAAPPSPASPPPGSVASPRSALSAATRQAPWLGCGGPARAPAGGGGAASKGKGWRWSTAGRPDTRGRPAPLVGRWREEKKGPRGKRLDRAATPATKKGVLPPRRGIEPRSPA